MAIYNIAKGLSYIKESPFKYERENQTLIENNLKTLLNLEFIQ